MQDPLGFGSDYNMAPGKKIVLPNGVVRPPPPAAFILISHDAGLHLTENIHWIFLESQLPHKTVNLLF